MPFNFPLAESARLMPVTASPMPAYAGAVAGLISRKPAAERCGDNSRSSGMTLARPAPTGITVGPESQLRHRSGLPDRRGDNRLQAAAISPAPCPSQSLRQPRRHYAAPASSDDAQNSPADNDLRKLAQVTAPRDELKARRIRRPCNAICPRPAHRGPRQPRRHLAHPEPWDKGSTR
jgi:hypothetical protein